MIFTKSVLDFISSMVFASSLGIGVMLSAAFVFVFQGAIVLLAQFVAPFLTDAVIAEKLFLSVRTVKQHIQSMRDKTGFRNRTELAVRARESGLVINDPKTE